MFLIYVNLPQVYTQSVVKWKSVINFDFKQRKITIQGQGNLSSQVSNFFVAKLITTKFSKLKYYEIKNNINIKIKNNGFMYNSQLVIAPVHEAIHNKNNYSTVNICVFV